MVTADSTVVLTIYFTLELTIGHDNGLKLLCPVFRTGRGVPDGAGPDALLNGGRHHVQWLHAELVGITGAPAAYRVFQHTHVVEGRHGLVKVRVGPHGTELRVAFIFGDVAGLQVDPGAVVRAAVGLGVRLATV